MSLEQRLHEVSLEIRNYPTPIARCDEQLTALIEERARLLERLGEPRCDPLLQWANDGGPAER
jgi:hypothetical protein